MSSLLYNTSCLYNTLNQQELILATWYDLEKKLRYEKEIKVGQPGDFFIPILLDVAQMNSFSQGS